GVSGSGFVDSTRPSQIWTVTVPSGVATPAPAKRLTSGEFATGNYHWSKDGSQIYFVSDRRREPYYFANDSDIYAVSKDGGEPVRLVSIEGSIGAYGISPDGKHVAFDGVLAGNPQLSFSQTDLWIADL